MEGRRVPASGTAAPLLTVQCFRLPGGELKFELLATDPAAASTEQPIYQAPWRPSPGVLFAPNLVKRTITMDFVGYTHVKPVKRQWEYPEGAAGILRYSTPVCALKQHGASDVLPPLSKLTAHIAPDAAGWPG